MSSLWSTLLRSAPSGAGELAALRWRARARTLDTLACVTIGLLLRAATIGPLVASRRAVVRASVGDVTGGDLPVAAVHETLTDWRFWVLWVGLGAVVSTVWHATFERTGATPGKRRLGLRVVDADTGRQVSASQAWVRAAVRALLPLTLGLGFLPALGSGRQALHDRVAGTAVVVDRRPGARHATTAAPAGQRSTVPVTTSEDLA